MVNEEETAQKMPVLAASGCYLPRDLTFGPADGPEHFKELVFIVFGRRLCREWFLFLDDLSVAIGRPTCLEEGPFLGSRCGRRVERGEGGCE